MNVKKGHIKSECPSLQKKNKVKRKKDKRAKKAYVEWFDNEIKSSLEEEQANITLMVSHHSDDEENEVSDSEINDIPYDKLQNAFHELY